MSEIEIPAELYISVCWTIGNPISSRRLGVCLTQCSYKYRVSIQFNTHQHRETIYYNLLLLLSLTLVSFSHILLSPYWRAVVIWIFSTCQTFQSLNFNLVSDPTCFRQFFLVSWAEIVFFDEVNSAFHDCLLISNLFGGCLCKL